MKVAIEVSRGDGTWWLYEGNRASTPRNYSPFIWDNLTLALESITPISAEILSTWRFRRFVAVEEVVKTEYKATRVL